MNKKKCFKALLLLTATLLIASVAVADVTITSDITRMAVGARPLGMGKAFVSIADDISALYLNPAGLSQLEALQLMSTSGRFVNQVNYLTFAAAAPTKFGYFGIGYTGAGMSFSSAALDLVEISTGEYRVIPSTTESVSYTYNNSAVSLAYSLPLRNNLSIGTALNIFGETLDGSTAGTASGLDLDVGVLFKPNSILSLGFLGKSVLPFSMGGKMRWGSSREEAIPSAFSFGGSLKTNFMRETVLGADYEMCPTQPNVPGFWHAGIEVRPSPIFTVRGGIDQDVIGSGTGTGLETYNNPTFGVSLKASDFRFDYAFHKYNDLSNNDTNYFSVVYQAPQYYPLEISRPLDKSITHESTVLVKGKVIDRRIKFIRINDNIIEYKHSTFEVETSLMLGKNTLVVAGLDQQKKVIVSKKIRVLRLRQFKDVPANHPEVEPIEYLGTLNIMPGFPDDLFKPDLNNKRADFLIDLLNIGKIPPATELNPFPFKDVEISEWIAPYAKAGYDRKLVSGYPDKTLRPWEKLSRVESAIMAVRFSKLTITDVLERPYLDISARHWAIKDISAAKQNNFLKFALEYLYPAKAINRAELASMLASTPKVLTQIQELLDFDLGY
ncbi:MAG: S-layer homology domain-containing protein [Candidatus Margulisiibacteriota bacterium]